MSIPEKLYKYKPVSPDLLDSLSKQQVWFAKPISFNDPFDCQLKYTSKVQYFESIPLYLNILGLSGSNYQTVSNTIVAGRSALKSDVEIIEDIENLLVSQNHPTVRSELDKTLKAQRQSMDDCGVLSLTEKNDNLLMWAHYASSHTGICLEFDTSLKQPRVPCNILSDRDYTRKVRYGEYYPSLIDLKPYDSTHRELTNNLLWYKSDEWSYEDEWRSINQVGDQLMPFPGKLTGIIFGARCTDKDQVDVINAVSGYSYKPDIYYSVIRDNRFAVEVVKL